MDDGVGVEVVDAGCDLEEELPGHALLHPPVRHHVVEQLAVRHHLHDQRRLPKSKSRTEGTEETGEREERGERREERGEERERERGERRKGSEEGGRGVSGCYC